MNDLDGWFESVGHKLSLKKGEILFLRGDVSRGPFLLLEGQVCLYRQDENGAEIALHRARPRERFAEASVFSDTYHCDCVAEQNSIVIAIPRHTVLKALDTRPEFASAFSLILAKQVMSLRTQLELRNIRSAEERVLSALRLKAGKAGIPFELEGTLKAFAGEIGLTHETLYRAIRKLEKSRHLLRNGSSFTINRS